jgi:hypothetical protein
MTPSSLLQMAGPLGTWRQNLLRIREIARTFQSASLKISLDSNVSVNWDLPELPIHNCVENNICEFEATRVNVLADSH